MGLGLEEKIAKMNPKNKKLIENLMSVGVILTIAYMFFGFSGAGSYQAFMQSAEFITGVMILIFIGFGWKLIKGGKIHIPEQPKDKKAQVNMPDVWGVRGQGIGLGKQQQQQAPQKTPQKPVGPRKPKLMKDYSKRIKTPRRGSWYCPRCKSVVIGDACHNCGTRRELKR